MEAFGLVWREDRFFRLSWTSARYGRTYEVRQCLHDCTATETRNGGEFLRMERSSDRWGAMEICGKWASEPATLEDFRERTSAKMQAFLLTLTDEEKNVLGVADSDTAGRLREGE